MVIAISSKHLCDQVRAMRGLRTYFIYSPPARGFYLGFLTSLPAPQHSKCPKRTIQACLRVLILVLEWSPHRNSSTKAVVFSAAAAHQILDVSVSPLRFGGSIPFQINATLP